jgi:hypothetical protein
MGFTKKFHVQQLQLFIASSARAGVKALAVHVGSWVSIYEDKALP